MIRRPPRSTQSRSSAASDVYKRQVGGDHAHLLELHVVVPHYRLLALGLRGAEQGEVEGSRALGGPDEGARGVPLCIAHGERLLGLGSPRVEGDLSLIHI